MENLLEDEVSKVDGDIFFITRKIHGMSLEQNIFSQSILTMVLEPIS